MLLYAKYPYYLVVYIAGVAGTNLRELREVTSARLWGLPGTRSYPWGRQLDLFDFRWERHRDNTRIG